jgi:hypothetical protein
MHQANTHTYTSILAFTSRCHDVQNKAIGNWGSQTLFFQWCMRHFQEITVSLTRAASNLLRLPFSEFRGVHDILGMGVRVRADSFIL